MLFRGEIYLSVSNKQRKVTKPARGGFSPRHFVCDAKPARNGNGSWGEKLFNRWRCGACGTRM